MPDNRLREIREKMGLTQVELGYRVKMASSNLSSIERGRLMPWPRIKKKLARVLKTPIEELFPKGGQDGR